MPCTQCEVLDVGKYSNPSFGPFSQVFGSVPGFFWLPKHLGCGIFELSTISPEKRPIDKVYIVDTAASLVSVEAVRFALQSTLPDR